jgi:ankyrin repeat protein
MEAPPLRPSDALAAFLAAAVVPRDAGHATGALDRAQAILAEHPKLATADIFVAAVLGDDMAVRRLLAADPASATAQGGAYGWDPLTYLCFSRYLRLDPGRAAGFVRAAAALLDAGADPNTGFSEEDHQPRPVFESAIYGACGLAHHPELTRLLLERGADPNDDETPYHTPETDDHRALLVLLESGKLNAGSLTTLLLRKEDWHDLDGVRLVLEHGANPNRIGQWGLPALHHALSRDNALPIVELLLDHGADPTLQADGTSAVAMAAWVGRGDVLALIERRGIPTALSGVDRLVAACARNDAATIGAISAAEPHLVETIRERGGELLARFAGVGNTDGVRHLLGLGIEVTALWREGFGYFDIARDSMALHVAAWRASHATVRLLIDCGAPVNLPDGRGRTPLALAIRACVDSYWAWRRTPESVEALLAAGARVGDVAFPSGYTEVDQLLVRYGRGA